MIPSPRRCVPNAIPLYVIPEEEEEEEEDVEGARVAREVTGVLDARTVVFGVVDGEVHPGYVP